MSEETRQALDEVERRLRDEMLVEMTEASQGESSHTNAWLEGSQSGMRFALRMIADARLALGDEAGAEGD